MATNAERQARYRQRHLGGIDGDASRLIVVVSVHAKAQINRLARHFGVTRRAMIEKLASEDEGRVLEEVGHRGERAYLAPSTS